MSDAWLGEHMMAMRCLSMRGHVVLCRRVPALAVAAMIAIAFACGAANAQTGDLAYNIPANGNLGVGLDLQSTLQALPTIGAGNVLVTGGPGSHGNLTPYTINFVGALATPRATGAPGALPVITTQQGTTPLGGGASGPRAGAPPGRRRLRPGGTAGPGPATGPKPTGTVLLWRT